MISRSREDQSAPPSTIPPFREFAGFVRDEFEGRYGRLGMTPDHAIALEREAYEAARDYELARGMDAAEFARNHPDIGFWEGQRIVAVFRPQPDGSLRVDRFDGPTSAGGGASCP